ncbi:MAG TPA: NAD+ synthase [Gammaproteobacteria bacterium]|nr:NAD+ synthase [Gammaproteobacteria bacterium]
MTKKIRIIAAQLDMPVGDIAGNLAKMITAAKTARDTLSADMIVFPELSLTGYPPEDLLLRKSFIDEANDALQAFKSAIDGIYCVVSHPHATSQGLYNSCSVIYDKTIVGRYAKQHLPNYGVFDECRYFVPGNSTCMVTVQGIPVGIVICEDAWFPGPIQQLANQGARLIVSPNASPFETDKHEQRHITLAKRAKAAALPIVYVNCVGGQDDLIFDGGSMVVDASGKICQHAGFFQETLMPVDIDVSSTDTVVSQADFSLSSEDERAYDALVLAVRDYIQKNQFSGVLIGVSGGIDSALTLAIAVDALGKEKVHAVLLPSRYTSEMSMEDALALIKNVGVSHDVISIEPAFESFADSLQPVLGDQKLNIVDQNIQSRCRGVIMMALSNQTGHLVLTTGNRSEMAVGYATLYGDMAGGFAVLKDVPKTWVYRLARLRNKTHPVIPERILTRAPTAELAPDQKDEDSLPPYDLLDKMLELYLDQELGVQAIVDQGFDEETVKKVVNLIHQSEYKRRQSPIGPRIHHKAFGRDRRYPVTSGFKK